MVTVCVGLCYVTFVCSQGYANPHPAPQHLTHTYTITIEHNPINPLCPPPPPPPAATAQASELEAARKEVTATSKAFLRIQQKRTTRFTAAFEHIK